MSQNIKVVFDTQIYLRGAIDPNSVCGRLFEVWTPFYDLHIADGIEAEILNVFSRSKIRAKFPQITDETVAEIRLALSQAARVSLEPEDILPVCRDPKDDIFLACAKAAQADYLVSEDKDLLVLERYENIAIVNALDFLRILESR